MACLAYMWSCVKRRPQPWLRVPIERHRLPHVVSAPLPAGATWPGGGGLCLFTPVGPHQPAALVSSPPACPPASTPASAAAATCKRRLLHQQSWPGQSLVLTPPNPTHPHSPPHDTPIPFRSCRYLEEAGCASVCINSCKVPTQAFFERHMGLPLEMKPNYEDFSCQFRWARAGKFTLKGGAGDWTLQLARLCCRPLLEPAHNTLLPCPPP